MSHLSVSLLGTFEITLGGKPVDRFRTTKAQALLICLLMNTLEQPESGLSREKIVELLWPWMPQQPGQVNLRQTLYQLRKAIPEVAGQHGQPIPFVLSSRQSLRINPDALYEFDVARFIKLLDSNDPEQLARATELYRDDFLVDFYLPDNSEFELWLQSRRARFRQDLLLALHRLAALSLERETAAEAEKYARRQLALDDLDERAHRQLLRALACGGRRTAALAHYDALCELLQGELGVEPSKETQALYEAISRDDLEKPVQSPFTASPSVSERVRNFPFAATPFIGRQQELAELESLLAGRHVRLVNLLGSGGSGKTRLAVEIATRLACRYKRGAVFVPLGPLSHPETIPAAIASALNLHLSNNSDEQEQLLNYLANKEMLLVLDNFEHLLRGASADEQLQGAPALLRTILRRAPSVQVIVTSREVVHLSDEHLYPLDGLSYPQNGQEQELMQYDAVQLFVDRARRVQPHFSPDEQQAGLRRLCQLVAGIPLALELAATWVQALDCSGIAAEIERRLAFLTTRLSDVPQRHRSMQAVFDHSWNLVSDSERRLLRQMSIFHGPCSLEAAAAIAGASASKMITLVEKSLLRRTQDGRYGMHELLRQYAGGKLRENAAEAQAVDERFASYYIDFLQQRRYPLLGPEFQRVTTEISAEVDNVRAAWEWTLAQRREKDVQSVLTAYANFHFYQSRFQEAAIASTNAVAFFRKMPPSTERDLALAEALNGLAYSQIRLGHFEEARTGLEMSVATYTRLDSPPPPGLGTDSALPLAIIALIQGNPRRALELAEPARAAATRRGDALNLTMAHYVLSSAYAAMGEYETAYTEAQRACGIGRRTGNSWFLGYALLQLGKTAQATGNYAEAKQHYQASASVRRRLNYSEGVAEALNRLGEIALLQREHDAAWRLFQEALALYQETNDQGGIAAAYRGLGQVAFMRMEYGPACSYLGQALSVAADIQFWTFVLSMFVDIGRLLLEAGEHSLGLELLALAQHHSAAEHETKTRATEELAAWRPRVDDHLFSDSLSNGKERELEIAVMGAHRILSLPLTFQ